MSRTIVINKSFDPILLPLGWELAKAIRLKLRRRCPLLADVLDLRAQRLSDEAKAQALNRLVDGYFSQGRVFHGARWAQLQAPFNQERGEGEPWGQAWRRVSGPALFLAVRNMPSDLQVEAVFLHLRREIGKNIERGLLAGETLDEFEDREEKRAPWPEGPEAEERYIVVECEFFGLGIERAEAFIDTFKILKPEERQFLKDYLRYPPRKLSEVYHIKEASLRKRLERIRRKLEREKLEEEDYKKF